MIKQFLIGRKKHLAGLSLIWLISICIMNMILPTLAKDIIDIASGQIVNIGYVTPLKSLITVFPEKESLVILTTGVAFLLVLINGFISYSSQSYERWIQNSLYRRISTNLLSRVMAAQPSFLQASSPAYLRSLISQESGNCSSMLLGLYSSTTVSVITLLASAAFILTESKEILLMFLGLLPLYFLTIRRIPEKIKVESKDGIDKSVQTQGTLDRIINGWRTAILYDLQKRAVKKYQQSLDESLQSSQKVANLQATFSARTNTFSSLCQFLLLAFIGLETLRGHMTIGSAIALSGVFSSFLSSFRSVCQLGNSFKAFQISLDRIEQLYASCKNMAVVKTPLPQAAEDIVRFENVTFRIDKALLLDKFSYQISKGEKIQICGPNGSGKSTLVNLIAGFQIAEGSITTPPLRKISLCFPNQSFLPLSIVEHIDSFVTNPIEEVFFKKLVDAFELNETLDRDPNLLSSGQKQKVAILLALLKRKSELYIFDEALANIDRDARRSIGSIIAECTKDKTVISITHEDNAGEMNGRTLKLKRLMDAPMPAPKSLEKK